MDGAPHAQDLPAPFVASDCDLTGYDWFPLHHKRLDQSEWWLTASDFARSRSVDLWSAAYQQVPAASLPNSDVILARISGFGRDLAAFRAVKAELLAPWTLCADGRWYHPVLAEVANEAWTRQSDRKAGSEKRSDKARTAARARWDRARGNAHECSEHCPDDASASVEQCHNTDRTGQSEEADASSSPTRERAPDGGGEAAWRQVREAYAQLVIKGRGSPMMARSAWLALSPADRLALPSAIRPFAEAKPWGSSGPPSLQRFIAEDVWRDFAGASVTSIVWTGPAELRAAVVAECGDAFARSYLDPAEWRSTGPGGVIVALSSSAATRLRTVRALAATAIQDPVISPVRRQA